MPSPGVRAGASTESIGRTGAGTGAAETITPGGGASGVVVAAVLAGASGTAGAGGGVRDGGTVAVAGGGRTADNGGTEAQAAMPSSVAANAAIAARVKRGRSKVVTMDEYSGSRAKPKGEPLPALGRTLYVVATPIGNLRDITLRALDILAQVDVVAAEDTRVTGILLAHYGIRADVLSLNEHNERRRAQQVLGLLEQGKRVALVTDAGTPAISDPGAALVRAVGEAGFNVVPVPGPSAVATALSASGIPAPQWLFYGFLPVTAGARKTALEKLAPMPCALVFYEAPHRIVETLVDLVAALGAERELVIARELTKHFESIHRCRLADAPAWVGADPNRQRGEFVLIVDAPPAALERDDAEHDEVLALLLAELPLARAVRLAAALTRAPKNRLYERALLVKAAREPAS